MQRVRFRLILPIAFGCLATVLMLWDYDNERVVESMGMAWDTGAPVWPYQAPSLFLFAINTPAYALAAPFFLLNHMQTLRTRYPLLLPLILLWWWIGTRIDFGLLGRRHYRHPKIIAWILFAAGLALLFGGTRGIFDGLSWWKEYRHSLPKVHAILLLKTVGPSFWCLILAGGSLMAGIRLLHGEFSSLIEH